MKMNMNMNLNMLFTGECSSDKKINVSTLNSIRYIYPSTRQNPSSADSVDLRSASEGGCHDYYCRWFILTFFKLAGNNNNK